MIAPQDFVAELQRGGVDFFTGVPDSLLKNFCAYVTDHCGAEHVIAANEGGAVGLAAGHYLATGKMALVYMQNSGQGNAVNPLASLADPDVYSIPMLLLVGWRGMPGVHDEPQHVKQGKVTISLFETLGIPTTVLPDEATEGGGEGAPAPNESRPTWVGGEGAPAPNESRPTWGGGALAPATWQHVVSQSIAQALREKRPVALVVKKGLFGDYALQHKNPNVATLPREQAIEKILSSLPADAVVVSTTGMISREVYELREKIGRESRSTKEDKIPLSTSTSSLLSCHARDFLTVGSMGHASMIALGIAKAQPGRPVFCLDGDGASIMQMGNMAIVGQSGCANLTHIVLNNAAHDSVGGQPTVGGAIDLPAIAKACGYIVEEASSPPRLAGTKVGEQGKGSSRFIEIKVAKGARKDLGRPKEPPQENKALFMKTLGVR